MRPAVKPDLPKHASGYRPYQQPAQANAWLGPADSAGRACARSNKVPGLLELDDLQTLFVSEIGRIEEIDRLVRFTLCERREMEGRDAPVLVPRICTLHTLEGIARDGALVRQYLRSRLP